LKRRQGIRTQPAALEVFSRRRRALLPQQGLMKKVGGRPVDGEEGVLLADAFLVLAG
jgi:hypothetical protein